MKALIYIVCVFFFSSVFGTVYKVSDYPTSCSANDVAVAGSIAYIATDEGISVVDLTEIDELI